MWAKMTESGRVWSHWPLAVNHTLHLLSEESRGGQVQKQKGLQIWWLEVGFPSDGSIFFFFFSFLCCKIWRMMRGGGG